MYPVLSVLEWLFAIPIGKTDQIPFEMGTNELFAENTLDKVRVIANKETSELKTSMVKNDFVCKSSLGATWTLREFWALATQ